MRRAIPFSKLNGSGNDFLIVDDRERIMRGADLPAFVRKVCDRSRSVGADGMIFIARARRAHFRWRFFNADGSVAEMCGNGGRCAARFAFERGIAPRVMTFETLAGPIRAEVRGRRVKLQMTPPRDLVERGTLVVDGRRVEYAFLDTGVPHAVVFVSDLEGVDVGALGRRIRFHEAFSPRGTNVDFVAQDGGGIAVRTYERGVEGETLACGTGAVAAGILAALRGLARPPVAVRTRGGEILTVHFDAARGDFGDVFLEGDTAWSCDGVIREEAYRY